MYYTISLRTGESALHISGQLGDANMVELLIQNGADLSLQDQNGHTMLHLLATQCGWDTDNSARFIQVNTYDFPLSSHIQIFYFISKCVWSISLDLLMPSFARNWKIYFTSN